MPCGANYRGRELVSASQPASVGSGPPCVYLSGPEQLPHIMLSRSRSDSEEVCDRHAERPLSSQSSHRTAELPRLSSSTPPSPITARPPIRRVSLSSPRSARTAQSTRGGQPVWTEKQGVYDEDPILKLISVTKRRCSRDIQFLEAAVQVWERGCTELEAELAESK